MSPADTHADATTRDRDGSDHSETEPEDAGTRKRAKPGERRILILEALARMLEQPVSEKITTAALAERLQVSEAALYRQFASKAQMFEGLIGYIEDSVFVLVNRIGERESNGLLQARHVVSALLAFAAKNPGMVRVMTGEALVHENQRLQQRMNQFFDRVEATLKQSLKLYLAEQRDAGLGATAASSQGSPDPSVAASVLVAFVLGRLHRFTKSGFKRHPDEALEPSLTMLLRA